MARFDLHTHTFYSDSLYSPESVVRAAMKKGLEGVAITDHNSFAGAVRALRFAEDKGISVIPGEEVLTDRGEVIGLFLSKAIAPGAFGDIVDEIRGQNGIVILPHPCDRLRRGVLRADETLAGVADAIETFNSRVIFKEDNSKAEAVAGRFRKARVGGSDAHFDFEVGSGWTEFKGDGEDGLRKAIMRGRTVAGGVLSTPFVHGFGKVANLVNRFRR